jgi:GNAT superfamily N-acetyltransferase
VSLHLVDGYPALLELSGHDPWVRWALDPASTHEAWHDPSVGLLAISRRSRSPGGSLVVLPVPAEVGPADRDAGRRAADALAAVLAFMPEGTSWITVTQRHAAVVRRLVEPDVTGTSWDWMWTVDPPAPQPGEPGVGALDAGDPRVAAELDLLLAEHSARHSAVPGSPDVAGWVGVRRHGRLIACAAWFDQPSGVPLLASVAVRPDARRRGLAGALTAAITRRALAGGAPAVAVDLYADNDAARRVYRRLGFVLGHAFMSYRRRPPGS